MSNWEKETTNFLLTWSGNQDFKGHLNLDEIKAFISKERKEVLNEAIQIFKKYKDEPMTGRVVILELEELKNK